VLGRSPAGYDNLGYWVRAGPGGVESLNLIEGQNVGIPAERFAAINVKELRRADPTVVVEFDGATSLCNGVAAWELRFRGRGRFVFQEILAVTQHHTYIATYERDGSSTDSAEGLAALRSLCPPADDPIVVSTGVAPLTAPAGWSAGGQIAAAGVPPNWVWFGPVTQSYPQRLVVMSIPTSNAAQSDDDALKAFQTGIAQRNIAVQIVERRSITLCKVTTGPTSG
jgi:hypothetical protein